MGVVQFDKEDSKVLIHLLEYQVITISINQHYVHHTDFIFLVYEATFCFKFQSDRRVMRQSAKLFENQIDIPCVKSL